MFQGLNANGGENAALIDAITLDGVLIPDGSFESPVVADYQYRPSNTAWTYSGSAGVTANGGTFTSSTSDAPDDNQVAFVEKSGSLKQTFAIASGNHMLSFQVAQAESVNESSQQLRVTLLGPATSTKSFVWSGSTIAEERDSSGANVKNRFFAEGEQRVGGSDAGNYYYSRDHLGSIREVTDSTGALKARYDYDAWGKSVVVSGNMNVDFGYTSHYFHQPSGLNLAMYRAYSPTLGRWLSRDPIGELGGLNLYGYVANDPLNSVDPDGLAPFYNNSDRFVVVGGGTGPGQGHAGAHIQVVVPPGGRVDVNNPAYDAHGNGPLQDVDTVDVSRDGIAPPPGGYRDLYPYGEKIPGTDAGLGFTAYNLPFSSDGIFLLPNDLVFRPWQSWFELLFPNMVRPRCQ